MSKLKAILAVNFQLNNMNLVTSVCTKYEYLWRINIENILFNFEDFTNV